MIFGDGIGGRSKLEPVVVQIGDEATQMTPPEAPAIAAEVNGVEVEADVGQMVSEVGLEEVVVPPVHVQHRPAMPLRRQGGKNAEDQRRDEDNWQQDGADQ